MKNELIIGEQTVKFALLQSGEGWRGSLLLADKKYDVEIETVNSKSTSEQVNWDKVEQVLKFILAKFSYLLEKANKNLSYFVEESGLYNPSELEEMKEIELEFIEILYPLSSQLAFGLIFYSYADPYGQWRVLFIMEHLVGVERMQL